MTWVALAAVLLQAIDYQAAGIKALDAKQYQQAAELFRKAVDADPKDYGAHFQLALAFSLLNQDSAAIPEYKKVLELKPGLYEAELNVGICLLRTKDAAAAVPYLKAAAGEKPKEPRPAYYYAQALLDAGQDAQAAFENAVALNALSAPAQAGLAQSLARQKKFDEAELHFRKAAEIDPAYKTGLLQLAQMYEDAHQADRAIAIYREFPDNPGAEERMGALLAQSGQTADAIPALEAAVAKSPTSANRIALAQAYVKSKQLEKAAPLAAQAVAELAQDYDLRMFYARILRDQRKFPEAAQQFLAASKLKPEAVQPWNEVAGVLIVAEQYPQALQALDQVRARGGETSAHYYLRAISLDHLHQLKDALANYNKFLEMSQGKSPDEEFKARQRARIIQNELNKR
ncbi:MAG: tetratricopeptide repeat protein [Acidobacteriia bacterium]|nr:tetratricopeptide repeat protein [Terriglobia bacterium]